MGSPGRLQGRHEWELTDGKRKQVINIYNTPERYKLIFFYPCDWEPASARLLSEVAKRSSQLLSCECALYACSSDSSSSHREWIREELGGCLPFSIIADPAGTLAAKFSMFDREEKTCLRGFVITDSHGQSLEVVTSVLGSAELVKLAHTTLSRIPRSKVILEQCGLKTEEKNSKLVLPKQASIAEKRIFSSTNAQRLKTDMMKKLTEGVTPLEDGTEPTAFNQYMSRTEARLARGFF